MKTLTQSILTLGTILAVAVAMPVAGLAQSGLQGHWGATFAMYGQRCVLDLVMDSRSYSETLSSGALMTRQSGTYTYDGSLLIRTVLSYAPEWQYVLGGYDGAYPHWQRMATPPGGTYRVTFTSADTMEWYDVNLHGTVVLHRL